MASSRINVLFEYQMQVVGSDEWDTVRPAQFFNLCNTLFSPRARITIIARMRASEYVFTPDGTKYRLVTNLSR